MIKKIVLTLILMILFTGCNVEYYVEIDDYNVREKLTIFESDVNKLMDSSPNSFKGLIDKAMNTHTSIYYQVNQDLFETVMGEGYIEYDKVLTDNNGYGIVLSSEHTLTNYLTTTIFNSCYEKMDAQIKNYELYLSTSKEFTCLNKFLKTDNVKIILNTTYEVGNHNADEVNGNNYIWYINGSNYQNKPLLLNFDTRVDYPDDPSSDIDIDDDNLLNPGEENNNPLNNQNEEELRQKEEEEYKLGQEKILRQNRIVIGILLGLILIIIITILVIYIKYRKNNSLK